VTIHRAVTAGGGAVILITFPPIINEWHAFGRDPYFVARGGLDRDVDHYRERTRLVAQRLDVPLFDLDQLLRAKMKEKGPKSCIAPDGVHLTPEGHALVSEAMQAFLVGQGWIPR
jgi:lysophospholipase L1-like esterase